MIAACTRHDLGMPMAVVLAVGIVAMTLLFCFAIAASVYRGPKP